MLVCIEVEVHRRSAGAVLVRLLCLNLLLWAQMRQTQLSAVMTSS